MPTILEITTLAKEVLLAREKGVHSPALDYLTELFKSPKAKRFEHNGLVVYYNKKADRMVVKYK